jgi:hypothetical protein
VIKTKEMQTSEEISQEVGKVMLDTLQKIKDAD